MAEDLTGQYGHIIMYVMTSEHTKQPTEEFFEKHNFFGLNKDKIVFFEQRMIPCFDFEGKIILANSTKVARAPDGNGGLYWALKHEGILEHMEQKHVEYLHVYCVDNVLVKVADPIFMGYCIDKKAESGTPFLYYDCKDKKITFLHSMEKRTILHTKWTLLKSASRYRNNYSF